MKMMNRFASLIFTLLYVASAAAFLPPSDTQSGVTLRIEGFK